MYEGTASRRRSSAWFPIRTCAPYFLMSSCFCLARSHCSLPTCAGPSPPSFAPCFLVARSWASFCFKSSFSLALAALTMLFELKVGTTFFAGRGPSTELCAVLVRDRLWCAYRLSW